MNNFNRFLTVLTIFLQAAVAAASNPAQLVNPMIGTDFTGNTYPGAQVPHGMVQLSPDNGLPGWDRIAGYFYPDSTIAGFSHTHLSGTGAGDLYDVSFLPVARPFHISDAPLGLHSRFSHDTEKASAGYYAVRLDDYGIDVELTATPRVGIQSYSWPEGTDTAFVVLNLAKAMNWDATKEAGINTVDHHTISGHRFSDGWARNQKVWFASRFSKPFLSMEIDTVGAGVVATFVFDVTKDRHLLVATALSGVDADGALLNLHAEAPHNDFDIYRRGAEALWNDKLSVIAPEPTEGQAELLPVFYTAVYHSLLAPTVASDVDGRYLGPDGEIHTVAPGHIHYDTYSTWDTYRAAHPLYTILEPREAADMAQSLADFGLQNGRLPVWTMWASETDMMIGYHSIPVIVDAVLKELAQFDEEQILALALRTAQNDTLRGMESYLRHGYVDADGRDSSWAMSIGLEYAYDDHAIARLARRLGRDSIAGVFEARARNYQHHFNPATGFMQPRNADGSFVKSFRPDAYTENICESNAWQYLWSVQQDIPGLKRLLKGDKAMERRLDQFFTGEIKPEELPLFSTGMIGQYAHGNEPSHHVAYLYNYVGRPDKTRHYVSKIMSQLYGNTPDGLCGNEDCGQMSAWYVMSALGFYPVNPVGGVYDLGVPLFAKTMITNPETGAEFVVENRLTYPQSEASVLLNGVPVGSSMTIDHRDVIKEGNLIFK